MARRASSGTGVGPGANRYFFCIVSFLRFKPLENPLADRKFTQKSGKNRKPKPILFRFIFQGYSDICLPVTAVFPPIGGGGLPPFYVPGVMRVACSTDSVCC